MKKISTSLQAKNAKAGVYAVAGASGFGFKKDSDTPGVGSYTVRFRLGARRPTMGLGAFNEISLADAREAAIEAVKLARKGIDPIEQRKREKVANLAAERAKQPITFRQAAEAYCELHAPSWKHRYAVGVWLKPTRAANVTLYESARQALSSAVMVDEVKDVLDRSAALVEYARCAAVTQSGVREPGAISAI